MTRLKTFVILSVFVLLGIPSFSPAISHKVDVVQSYYDEYYSTEFPVCPDPMHPKIGELIIEPPPPEGDDWIVTEDELERHLMSMRDVYPLVYNFSITISFEWDASASSFRDMEGCMRRFAKLLYDYTDGQFGIVRVDMYKNKKSWNSADIHVLNRYNYRANAVYGGIRIGGYIQLGRDHYGQPWDSPTGAVVVAHEWGHYAFFCPDEYTDQRGPLCNNDSAGTCIMSNPYRYFEFCTQESHDSSSTGLQYACWEYIHHYWPKTVEVRNAPDQGPNSGAPVPDIHWHFPDLFIDSSKITYQPPSISEGDELTIHVIIENKENLVSKSIEVTAYLDDKSQIIDKKTVYIASPSVAVDFTWKAIGGTHIIYIVADTTNLISEASEDNNEGFIVLKVNNPPKIDDSLSILKSKEDVPLVADMSKYESDEEDSNKKLNWTVTKYDKKVIKRITGQNSEDDILTFYPRENWYGDTLVELTLTDSHGASASKNVTLIWESVNDLPVVTDFWINKDEVKRTGQILLYATGFDVEDGDDITSMFEYRASSLGWTEIGKGEYSDGQHTIFFTISSELPIGNYSFRVMFLDSDGGNSTWYYLNDSVNVLNNPPLIRDVSVENNEVFRGDDVNISCDVVDVETPAEKMMIECQYGRDDEWHDIEYAEYDKNWKFVWETDYTLDVGLYDIRVRVTDEDKDHSKWHIVEDAILIKNNPPIVEDIISNEYEIVRNESCKIYIYAHDYENVDKDLKLLIKYITPRKKESSKYIEEVEWDEKKNVWVATFFPRISANIGKYTIMAKVVDADGDESDWCAMRKKINVLNSPPNADFTCPREAYAGDIITFSADNSSDLEDKDLTYTWNFGDGSTGTGISPSYAYKNPGIYDVVLTVSDKDGATSSAKFRIIVREREENIADEMEGINIHFYLVAGVAIVIVIASISIIIVRKKRKKLPPYYYEGTKSYGEMDVSKSYEESNK